MKKSSKMTICTNYNPFEWLCRKGTQRPENHLLPFVRKNEIVFEIQCKDLRRFPRAANRAKCLLKTRWKAISAFSSQSTLTGLVHLSGLPGCYTMNFRSLHRNLLKDIFSIFLLNYGIKLLESFQATWKAFF